jgi:tripartite-type tricarboxylate transporter receptor subunit TctC
VVINNFHFDAIEWTSNGSSPTDFITKLNREIIGLIQSPDIRERLTDLGLEPLGTSAEENARHLQAEISRWRAFIQRHDIRPH